MIRSLLSPGPRPSTGLRILIAATVAVALTACDPPGAGESAARTGCAAQVAEASQAVEVDEQVALLDAALVTCRSYRALSTAIARYPGIIGYDVLTFVSQRCERIDDELIRLSPACSEIVAPTTAAPSAPTAELLFVGETLDGRRVEIRPDDDIRFVDGVPEEIQRTVDIALEDGCEGVVAQRDLWLALVEDALQGDRASVYARHAENVMDYIGCVPGDP